MSIEPLLEHRDYLLDELDNLCEFTQQTKIIEINHKLKSLHDRISLCYNNEGIKHESSIS